MLNTTTTKRATDFCNDNKVSMPAPEQVAGIREEDMAICSRFMRHLRHVPNNRMEIKILSSIQFTADFLGLSDAHVARVLVDMGLRAPRVSFPADYLRFADECLMRSGWEVGGPSKALLGLKDFWDRIGEDKFAHVQHNYSILQEDAYV